METKVEVKLNPRWKSVGRLLDDVVQLAARNVERKAKETVPVDTGATRDSIEARHKCVLTYSSGPSTHYAPFLEFGTVKMAARPYLIPAVESESPKLRANIAKILEGLK